MPENAIRGILEELGRCAVNPRPNSDRSRDDLDDDGLDRVLDRGFEAAGTQAEQDEDSTPSVLDRIGEVAGSKPKVSLRDADEAGQTPMLKPLGPDDAHRTGKYVVQGELGRGGVGAVHRGHDQDLGRDVAMKFLLEKYKDEPAMLHRFVEEAQIGGQLQHPGIVPVYDLGMSNGRPFFAMKLVKGKTLAQALAERASPATDRRHFLAIFEQVCQTMAYAHTRGVVHRDLKPANIMIGSFGEVQVVDWGMGKVLVRGGVADEKLATERQAQASVIETVRSGGHGTKSMMGSVMGTPAYMPPEQARGDVEAMDARSDVFSLGSILCEILTGQPPYVGEQDELIRLAAMGKLDDAHERLRSSGADGELVELTTRCLILAPAARPQSAEVVAKAVHAHLAAVEQRVHDARVEAAETKAREVSLRRTQKFGVALTLVIAVGLAVSLWFWRDSETQRKIAEQAATDAETAEALEKKARKLADTKAKEAQATLANFDRLSYVVRLAAAKEKQDALYPAWPAKAQAMHDWLDGDAKELEAALSDLRPTLVALEARALPPTDEERADRRRTHPRAAELATLETKLSVLRKAQGVRAGARYEPFTLDESGLPETHGLLNARGWPLVAPARSVFGREAEGLALVRRALALAPESGDDRAMVADSLAWGLFAVGLDDEAIEHSRAALAAASAASRGEYRTYLMQLEAKIEAARGPEGQAAIDVLAAEVAQLQVEVAQRRDWRFADGADQFLYNSLRELVADIEAFAKKEVPAVEQQLFWAERVEELTITRYQEEWEEARLAILAADGVTASKRYAERRFELKPQMGLVPIGMNPQSKLWEFYHLRSAWDPEKRPDPATIETPSPDEHGGFDMDGRGIVFVLVPGGRFLMGAQSRDPSEPNFDVRAQQNEGPVREVNLQPYLLAKHELTQGQWARLTRGQYPSWYKLGTKLEGAPVPIGDSNPVEQVSWPMCDQLFTRHGLILPTEAQWERGCRGGTSTPWFTGDRPQGLEGFANVLDETGRSVPPRWEGGEAFDDHFKEAAPVGTYGPNPFGLYDVHGNVFEWCREWFGRYFSPPRAGDGLLQPGPSNTRAVRGGDYRSAARPARSSQRHQLAPSAQGGNVGVRPAREIAR